MDAFGYISVIFSVVIGLGMSQLLTGMVELVKARRRVKFYWVHLLWVTLTFTGHIFLWWTMWNLRLLKDWHFFSFLLLLLAPVMLFVAASFLIPKLEPDDYLDLRHYFIENKVPFFTVNAAFTLLLGMQNWLLTGHMSPPTVTLFFSLWFVILCISAITKNQRFHAIIAIFLTILFLLFVLLFGLRLRT
jgi:cell division protein FtsW (lipid II flippase)